MQSNDSERRSPRRMSQAIQSSGEQQFDLSRLAAIFWAGKWWLLLGAVLGVLVSFYYLAITPNVYESDALLQIQKSDTSPLTDIGSLGGASGFSSQSVAQSEIPIIKSREVIGGAVEDLSLTTTVERYYAPLFGRLFASDARIDVEYFKVDDRIEGGSFLLNIRPSGAYSLTDADGNVLGSGVVGERLEAKTGSGARLSLLISAFSAREPATYVLSKTPWLATVHGVQAAVNVTEVGDKSGILSLSISGPDKTHITEVLNSVVDNYVEQNIEARSKEASKSLEFLNSQLPKLKKRVNDAEQRLTDYQEKTQPVELGAQAQAFLTQASNLQNRKSELRLKIAELRQQYTSEYPELQAAQDQYANLSDQIEQLQSQINELPSDQKTMLSLQRDVKVNTELYTSLLNRAQSLQIVKAGTIGNVRIIDPAVVPLGRVAPKPKVAILVGFLLGVLVAGAIILARVAMRRGISDPAELETHTGFSVFGVIPYSAWLTRKIRGQSREKAMPILARDHPSDVVVEALRSLRTSLEFTQMERESNVVMVTGPAPGVGKSFLSLNLGYLQADTGRKVLVIDADMRRGHLHNAFAGDSRGVGLSDILAGGANMTEAARQIGESSLHMITSGAIPPNPAELLTRPGFAELVKQARAEYDLVIVDAPPILAVTDAGIIANAVERLISLVILKSGAHPWKEIDEAVARFERQGGAVTGLVLNRYRPDQEQAYYGYGHYQYAYDSSSR